MLNKNLSFQECLTLLNIMAKGVIEWDSDCDSVTYIIVESEKIYTLQVLIPDSEDLAEYVYNYGGDDYEEYGIDISVIWGEICERFNKEVWFNGKKKSFYVVKWYHLVSDFLKEHKRKLEYKIASMKARINNRIYVFKANRRQKKRIKKLVKAYDNNH